LNKKVVYTSVFGDWDDVQVPKLNDDWDWIYFNEKNSLCLYEDNNRNAKRFKVLPHRWLEKYEYSIFVDGNFSIKNKDTLDELIEKYLSDTNIALYDHAKCALDPRDCIYEEAKVILEAGDRNYKLNPSRGILAYKDNPNIIKKQIKRYREDGYPEKNGLTTNMIMLRRHNEPDVIKAMEYWWKEIKYNSRRDQLSFNYSAWKTDLKWNWLPGDIRNNEYFVNFGAHKGKK
tara:strand:+ start:2214 stop:2906 length:693 start_codon:yes stop_codon:yes gene_type:complete